MAARVGFSATISRESRQARKGATVTVMSGAGEVPARAASNYCVESPGPFETPSKGVTFAC
jgi:hypothetical protein